MPAWGNAGILSHPHTHAAAESRQSNPLCHGNLIIRQWLPRGVPDSGCLYLVGSTANANADTFNIDQPRRTLSDNVAREDRIAHRLFRTSCDLRHIGVWR